MGVLADELVDRLEAAATWPIEGEAEVWSDLVKWIAFRDNDRALLKGYAGVTSSTENYVVDPLPQKLSGAFSTLLFGRPPKVRCEDEADQERMDEILRVNRWASRLRVAADRSSSEGEVWWRLVADPARFTAPALTWHSRLDVIPHYVNQQLRAVAFINVLSNRDDGVVFRHFEVHDAECVRNVLFRGQETTIGVMVDLADHPAVEELEDEWTHDVGILAGRVVNLEGQNPEMGVSDYDGLEDWFLELNSCMRSGIKNRALTAVKKAYAPRESLTEGGDLPEGNVVPVDADSYTGEDISKQYGTFELTFDAEALVTWANHVATHALAMRGITPQFVGLPVGPEGYAATGTALRMRLIPSTNEGDRRKGPWDDELDGIVLKMQILDQRPVSERGYGNAWRISDKPPAVEMGEPLPVDEMEDSTRLSTLRAADLISIEQGVRERNPDWSPTQVKEEVALIRKDRESSAGSMLLRGRPRDSGDGGQDEESEGADLDESEGTSREGA